MRPNHLPCIIVLSLFVVALLAGDVAAQVYVDVVINGHRLYQGGLVHQDRTYVRLDDVATVLGGEMIYDPEIKVAFVNTGRYRQLRWRTLVQLNPELQAYQPMSPMAAGEGVHYGIPGPHLTVLVSPAGVVTGFQLAAPQEQTERLPWFDQEEPVALPGVGRGYTHTLYVVQPELIELGGGRRSHLTGCRCVWRAAPSFGTKTNFTSVCGTWPLLRAAVSAGILIFASPRQRWSPVRISATTS